MRSSGTRRAARWLDPDTGSEVPACLHRVWSQLSGMMQKNNEQVEFSGMLRYPTINTTASLGPTWRPGAKRDIRPSSQGTRAAVPLGNGARGRKSAVSMFWTPANWSRGADFLPTRRFTCTRGILRNARILAHARDVFLDCQPAARPREPLQPCAPLACIVGHKTGTEQKLCSNVCRPRPPAPGQPASPRSLATTQPAA